jgi:ribosomal protein L11 methyltransferase
VSPEVWTEVALRVRPEAAEAVADLLQELTGRGVTIEPAIEALGPDEGFTLDESAPLRLLAYFEGPVSASGRGALRRLLKDQELLAAVEGRLQWRPVREEDWAETWKEHYDIERVGRLVIRPAWREYEASRGEVVISLDPGMAFGTGQHATTRMCLEGLTALEQGTGHKQQGAKPLRAATQGTRGTGGTEGTSEKQEVSGLRVLDLGSGSGILAIAAVALGAEWVLATDTEEMAVKASIENAALNGMQDRITVRPGSIEAVGRDGPFDVILANINAAAVTSLVEAMAKQLKPGAWLFAGGVIAEREAGVAEALRAAGLRIEQVMTEGDWRTFVARR